MLTPEQFAKVNKIIGLTLMINEQGKYCTFLRFSGHIDVVEIDIRKSKDEYHDEIADSRISLKGYRWENKTLDNRLDEVIEVLGRFVEEVDIPYDYLREIERIEYNYEF